MIPYEILIRGNAAGEFQGAHAIDVAGGSARPITTADLESLAPSINAASLVLATKIGELEAFKTEMVGKVSAALQVGTVEAMQALAVEFLTPEEDKKRAEKLAQLEALKAELGL